MVVLRGRGRRGRDPGQSLGQGHGGVGVGVEELLVQRREQDVDRLRVQLLEGLQLLGVQRAESRQRGDTADQLREGRGRATLDRGRVREPERGSIVRVREGGTEGGRESIIREREGERTRDRGREREGASLERWREREHR